MNREGDERKGPELLVLCQLFYPELISTGQTLTELCEELAGSGVDVEVACGPPTLNDTKSRVPRYMEHRGIRIRRMWGTRFPKLNLAGRVLNQVTYALSVFLFLLRDTSRRPVLVLTNPPFLAVACALLRVFGGKPYIYLIFDVYPDTAVRLGLLRPHGLLARIWDLSNRFVFAHASSIVVIGRCMQQVVRGKLGDTPADKVRTIHIWSDDRHIQSAGGERNPFLERWGLEGKFVLLYSGNMGRFHDMETIMEAAGGLRDYEDILFLFIGEGHKKRWMTEFARKRGLENCQFYPYVRREDLGHSLSCADVGLVSLSEGQEGLSVPSKTLGLLAAGVPVIAVMSLKSEIARILLEERCGTVVAPGDSEGLKKAVIGAYEDKWKLLLNGLNARQAVKKKYNLHSAARAYHDIVRGIHEEMRAGSRGA